MEREQLIKEQAHRIIALEHALQNICDNLELNSPETFGINIIYIAAKLGLDEEHSKTLSFDQPL